MPDPLLSRRTFLAAAGLGTTAVLLGCDLSGLSVVPTPTPNVSPASPGPYQTSRVILGEGGFPPLPLDPNQIPGAPTKLSAAVYFPTDTVIPSPTRFSGALPLAAGPYKFPLVLYGHAIRTASEPVAGHPLNRDFTTVDTILGHIASYGCVCLAPDLSWSGGVAQKADWQREAVVFVKVFQYLAVTLNHQLFNDQVRMTSVMLVGHSHRAGTVVNAGRALPFFQGPKPLAYGLIAPEAGGDTGGDISNLLVLGGTLDIDQAAAPQTAYGGSATPKTWVEIPGANHFGYTDLVSPDNLAVCNCSTGQINLLDENGTISRADQQQTAAAYLAALARYYVLGDGSARGYLSGERQVEGLNVTGIQLQAQGVSPPTPTPSRPTPGPNV
jgi:hypothetical protein